MGLWPALVETYDNLSENGVKNLLKIAQSTQNVHVEIRLDKEGCFRDADFVGAEHAETKIPVTEDSASRGSGSFPHPLFDKLQYMAGDFAAYCGEDNTIFHRDYMEALKNWCESEYAVPQIQILYRYLQKNTLVSDLVEAGIFSVDEKGLLTKKWEKAGGLKMSAGEQKEAVLRFRISIPGAKSALWEDEELQDRFIQYYLSQEGEVGFCHVTGEITRLSNKHPSKIRFSGDKAKLISSNDTANFTYRGRVENPEQVYTIGYIASQKGHNALKYLVRNQGVRVGDKCFVLWGVHQEKVPALLTDTMGLISGMTGIDDVAEERIAEAFNAAILGYRREIREDSQLCLVGLDAATKGRMALIFYREYHGKRDCNELIDRIENWHRTCAWNMTYRDKEKKTKFYMGAPAPFQIAKVVYGTEQDGVLDGNEKILASAVERILPCICDGRKIPRDMVMAAVNKAKFPQNYSKPALWQQVLSTACALYRKYLSDYKKEAWTMEVKETDDLDYNCGRLLAVADAIERWALYDKEGKEKDKEGVIEDEDKGEETEKKKKNVRTTTAMRYYTRFCQKPCITWGEINRKLSIYKNQLGARGRYLYDLLGDISDKIDMEEFSEKRNLDGKFCLGFDSQRRKLIQDAMMRKKGNKNHGSIAE